MFTSNNSFDEFITNYGSVQLVRYSDYLVYSCTYGRSEKAVKKANELIEKLGLDLVAVSSGKDSYVIKSNQTYEL